jgi:hypothetical protein
MCSNCALRSGCVAPSLVMRLRCTLSPAALSNAPTVHAPMGCACRVNSSAKRAVLLPVQRNTDCGSPRLTGSTNASSAFAPPGQTREDTCVRLLSCAGEPPRPPEGSSCAPRLAPLRIVLRDRPIASLTALRPLQPEVWDSVAAQCPRIRSSINGASERYRDVIWRIAEAACVPA